MTRPPLALLLLALTSGCDSDYADSGRRFAPPIEEGTLHPTVVHEPTAYGVLDTPIFLEAEGRELPAGAACETCHGPEPQDAPQRQPGETFHEGMQTEHGTLRCDQCHARDRSRLRLADDRQLPFVEVMQLCAQCHGPQHRDFQHGAHGGMNGYWDLRQGPRMRNTCVDCHAPHRPAIAQVQPVLPPRDRNPRGH